MFIQKKRIVADEEIIDEEVIDEVPEVVDEVEEVADVDVAPEATELLFETEDVAELIAEVTGLPVEVTADEEAVVFAVGDDEFTVEPEGDEEILEAVKPAAKNKVTASAKTRKPIKASTNKKEVKKPAPVVIRKNPTTKK